MSDEAIGRGCIGVQLVGLLLAALACIFLLVRFVQWAWTR